MDKLVSESLAAKMSRRDDAFATPVRGGEARAVARKKALAVIERQVARVDRAVSKVRRERKYAFPSP